MNLVLICKMLQLILGRRKVPAQNKLNISLTSVFEYREFSTTFNFVKQGMRRCTWEILYIFLRMKSTSLRFQTMLCSCQFSSHYGGTKQHFKIEPINWFYFYGIYKSVRQQIFLIIYSKFVNEDHSKHLPRSFVGFLQVFKTISLHHWAAQRLYLIVQTTCFWTWVLKIEID